MLGATKAIMTAWALCVTSQAIGQVLDVQDAGYRIRVENQSRFNPAERVIDVPVASFHTTGSFLTSAAIAGEFGLTPSLASITYFGGIDANRLFLISEHQVRFDQSSPLPAFRPVLTNAGTGVLFNLTQPASVSFVFRMSTPPLGIMSTDPFAFSQQGYLSFRNREYFFSDTEQRLYFDLPAGQYSFGFQVWSNDLESTIAPFDRRTRFELVMTVPGAGAGMSLMVVSALVTSRRRRRN